MQNFIKLSDLSFMSYRVHKVFTMLKTILPSLPLAIQDVGPRPATLTLINPDL